MKKNVGINDAAVRIVIALIFLALWGLKIVTGVLAIVLLVIGAVFVLTSVFDYCPLYGLFGINSRKKDEI